MVTLYGIPNCDKVRAARRWFATQGMEVRFHDFRRDGVTAALLERFLGHADWERLLNRTSPTWRALPEERRALVQTEADAIAVMLEHPTLIRRPVVERDGTIEIGFRPPAS
jgi:arsenate reductase